MDTGLPTGGTGYRPNSDAWFNAKNRLKDLPAEAAAYDNAGNQRDVAPYTLTYDAENRVVSATSAVNGNATYEYDGEGRRVRSVVGSVTTTFVYDASGQLAAEYATQPVAASGVRYLFADHLGSTRVTTKGGTATGDGTNLVVSRQDYLPYGETLVTASRTVGLGYGGTAERQQFTGHLRDQETGLDYMEARYFAGVQGRFLSPDAPLVDQFPETPQSWNLYSYTRNNPLRFVDPSGSETQCPPGDAQCAELQRVGDAQAGSILYDLVVGGVIGIINAPSNIVNWVIADANSNAAGTGEIPYVPKVVEPSNTTQAVGEVVGTAFAPYLAATALQAVRNAGAVEVIINSAKSPQAAAHIQEAQAAGHPSVLTVERSLARPNRKAALADTPTPSRNSGLSRDEYPPACCREGGAGSSVRVIRAHDNSSAGAQLGNQIRTVPNGAKIRITVK